MEFRLAEHQEPGADVYLTIENPTPEQIRKGFRVDEIWYGDHFILSDESGNLLIAVNVTGPYLSPNEPGEFLLYDRSDCYVTVTRAQVILAFIQELSKGQL
ncbi:hypothetical protein [Hymenobacter jeollabukensis]|uniref:Uncharacterized protein n=1 Tax=Hymenobacter jeollabukensis TaxID=2025313 RepID=A0A5R8WL65_9BACT|nr:hypothetical protein [Hymenobacter jeollabukensis]TLM89415.1 hypothetical protein FDY95_20290 [Hymenobacter jeollabukensis]